MFAIALPSGPAWVNSTPAAVRTKKGRSFRKASTSSRDRGFLVRVSPLEWMETTRGAPVGLDVAYGWSELSYSGGEIQFPNENPDPISRHRRNGYALRLAAEMPGAMRDGFESRGLGWLAGGFEPLASLGFASDRATIGPSGSTYKTEGSGFEITLANVLAYRFGQYEDRLGDIDGSTDGWSIGLPIGRVAGVRYERGKIPQAESAGLPDVERKAISGWVDPLELWALLRRHR